MGRSDRDDISIHFHLDRQLLDLGRPVHLHVHLGAGNGGQPAGQPARRAQGQQALGPRAKMLLPCIIVPANGSTVNVRDDGPGYICGYGHMLFGVNPPKKVWGKVYLSGTLGDCLPTNPNIPAAPPADATPGQIVNGPGSPPFPPVPNPAECNFAFHHQFAATELPVAGHAASPGVENCLVVWGERDDQRLMCVTKFVGVTATQTDCEGPSPSAAVTDIELAVGRPNIVVPEYTLRLDRAGLDARPPELQGRRLKDAIAGREVRLRYDPFSSIPGVPVWTTAGCRKKYGSWQLRQTHLGTSLMGQLSLLSAGGVELREPLQWRLKDWRLDRSGQFTAAAPKRFAQSASACTVTPA